MIRTQIYLPEETHINLLKLAKAKGTTLSKLVREGAEVILKKSKKGLNPQEEAIRFFANIPKKYRSNLTGKQLIELLEKDRDE